MKTRKTLASIEKEKKTARTGNPKPPLTKCRSAGPRRPSPKTPSQETPPRAQARQLQVYKAWCKKCGICVAFCPAGALARDAEGYPSWGDAASCTNCGLCELRCPDFAIEVFDFREEDREAAV